MARSVCTAIGDPIETAISKQLGKNLCRDVLRCVVTWSCWDGESGVDISPNSLFSLSGIRLLTKLNGPL